MLYLDNNYFFAASVEQSEVHPRWTDQLKEPSRSHAPVSDGWKSSIGELSPGRVILRHEIRKKSKQHLRCLHFERSHEVILGGHSNSRRNQGKLEEVEVSSEPKKTWPAAEQQLLDESQRKGAYCEMFSRQPIGFETRGAHSFSLQDPYCAS